MILRRQSEVFQRANQANIPVISVPRYGGDGEPLTLLRFYRIFQREKPDAIILTNTKDYWVCGLTAYLAKVPRRALRLSIVRPVKDNLKYKLIYRKFVNCVIVNSQEVEEGIRESASWLKEISIRVLYNGIDPPPLLKGRGDELRKKWGIPEDAFVFGACVNITRRKRLDLIISALANLREELPNAYAVLAGKGNALLNLEALAKDLGVNDRVYFPGYVEDVMPLYDLFDTYVISSEQESMTYVGMQALAYGCPVVATDCGGIKELLNDGECGEIVPVNDLSALQTAMLELATSETLRITYAQKGKERFEKHFTAARMGDNLEEILHS